MRRHLARQAVFAGAALLLVRFGFPAGIGLRLLGGGECVEDEFVVTALILRFHELVTVEGAVGAVAAPHFASDAAGEIGGLEFRDGACGTLAFENA